MTPKTVWCDACGTRIHQAPVTILPQRIRDWADPPFVQHYHPGCVPHRYRNRAA